MVTVGYGDISAVTTVERLFSIFAMTVAAGLYTFNLNTIGTKVA